MGLMWQKQKKNKTYEVRSAGASVRLYTNGVFHSQYNPNHVWTGTLWDLMSLPIFFYQTTQIKRVLVLGIGGGTVLRQLDVLLPKVEIHGVDLDQTHIQIAMRFFKLKRKNIVLHHADAREWLRDYSGEKFDLIIDDLFSDEQGVVQRAIAVNDEWRNYLLKQLATKGILAINFLSNRELVNSAIYQTPLHQQDLRQCYQFRTPLTENTIAVFLTQASSISNLKTRLHQTCEQHQLNAKRLRFRAKCLIP
ncbi:MAG: fused MFS/spermidine synthase [Gammaproteobacteria bacterium]|nr:fused MFS/spermidine synthase [Gammaproteobacteria bacterium]